MGFRFQRRLNITRGFGLHISKSGVSPSLRTGFGSISFKGFSIRTGIPGLSYRQSFGKGSGGAGLVLLLIVVFIALLPFLIQLAVIAIQIAAVVGLWAIRFFVIAPYNLLAWGSQTTFDYIKYRWNLRGGPPAVQAFLASSSNVKSTAGEAQVVGNAIFALRRTRGDAMEQTPYKATSLPAFGTDDFANNPDPRCPCLLLLDKSGSMSGAPIRELNEGILAFKDELLQDALASKRVEISIVSFGQVTVDSDFQTAPSFIPPHLDASGDTPMGAAIRRGLELLASRKQEYRAHGIAFYRPWVFLVTDGGPT